MEQWIKNLTQSKFNYIFSFYFDAFVALLFIGLAIARNDFSFLEGVGIFVLGVLFFSFIEYAFHAWLFHGTIKIFVKGHAAHHANPFGYDALPFFFGSFVALLIYIVGRFVVGDSLSLLFAGGVLVGYLAYGVMHHAMHRVYPKNRYFRYMVKLHDMHHQNIKMNHGVTSPIWDIIFKTYDPNPPKQTFNSSNKEKRETKA